ncbi:N-terminal kinase-like protein yata [Dermacentor variabilis]|uniref:N-terminal kinase-like protein yata n=1 Tax=Dermacentor variabilis TaxID=34621 RepID=UPI003F5B06D1
MWSFFARDPAKDFGYEIGELVPGLEEKSLWQLHKGKKKGGDQDVSVFVFEAKSGSESLLDTAKASVKRLKTLRHPNVLQYVDSLETEKVIYLVTEYVEPLVTHLEVQKKDEEKKLGAAWGLYQVTKGLGFLTGDCGLSHNNICSSSIFVNRAGEWKIGGVEYMCPVTESPPRKNLSALDVYTPPELKDSSASHRRSGPKWARDSWGLGCLMWEVFNGPLLKPSCLESPGKIPKSLTPAFNQLTNSNINSRPSPADVLTRCRSAGGFFKNSFVDTMLFIEEIQIKDTTEKNRFFTGLTSVMDNFPTNVCKYKILPQLINAFEFGDAGSVVLSPLFKIGKLLDAEEFKKKIVPCVVKLFSSKDRATRARLLQQVDQFVDYLSNDVLNQEVFPHVVQGFSDTNPTIREQTVKAIVHLAPKLSYNNLNEEVMQHFARLQSKDDQGGIRTNTTVCLGKIAGHLHPQVRQRVLIVAFTRAMRDPFHPSRMAAILALSATQGYFTLKDCATRVLPALCALTMDPEKTVRDHAFSAIKGFLGKLEKVSEDPSLAEQMEADVNAASSSVPSSLAASWAGWAVTSLTSKFYRSKPTASAPAPGTTGSGEAQSQPSSNATSPATESTALHDRRASEDAGVDSGSGGDDKWDDQDDWGDMEEDTKGNSGKSGASPKERAPSGQDGWDDGDWESFEEEPTPPSEAPSGKSSSEPKPPDARPTSSYNWGTTRDAEEDFFCSAAGLGATKQPPKPTAASSKQSPSSENAWENDDWDKWGTSKGPTLSGKGDSKSEESRQQREAKRQQRQKELQERRAARQAAGPMKLGVKKEF